jgi:hypothetical protein
MKVFVLFKQGRRVLHRDQKADLEEATKIALALNDSMQAKARSRGFHYTVEVVP